MNCSLISSTSLLHKANCLDCNVSVCDAATAEPLILASGMYELESDDSGSSHSSRIGGLQLFVCTTVDEPYLRLAGSASSAGIFDFQWISVRGTGALLCAHSDGAVSLYDVQFNDNVLPQPVLADRIVVDNSRILTCLDSTLSSSAERCIVVGDSQGNITLLLLSSTGFTKQRSWAKAHTLPYSSQPAEVWATMLETRQHSSNCFYSGADDCCLKLWDFRVADCVQSWSELHSGCGILDVNCEHQSNEHVVTTGGYDDCVCVWDSRNWSSPLSRTNVGGGAWKLQWWSNEHLLVACMYNGWSVVRWSASTSPGPAEILAKCSEYGEKLLYGACWLPLKNNRTMSKTELLPYVATSTFYDATVRLYAIIGNSADCNIGFSSCSS